MKRTIWLFSVLLLVGAARADVSLRALSRISMLQGLGTMEMNMFTQYQGDKRSETDTFRMVGGLAGAFAGGRQSGVKVTRLDKDVTWDINHPGRQYTEEPIALLTDADQPGIHAKAEGSASGSGSSYRITRSDFKTEKTGEKKSVNGFPCTRYIVTWNVMMEDSAAKKKLEQTMTMDIWATPFTDKLRTAELVQAEFNRKLAAKMSSKLSPAEADRYGLNMMTTMYGVDSKDAVAKMAQLKTEMDKVEGYPIITDLKWQMKADEPKPAAVADEPEDEEPATASPLGGLGSMLGNALGKKLNNAQPAASADVLFTSYVEVKSVAVADVPAAEFEIPQGYTKTTK